MAKTAFWSLNSPPKSCLIHWIIQLQLKHNLCRTSSSTWGGIWSRQNSADEAVVDGWLRGPRATHEGEIQLHHCTRKRYSTGAPIQLINISVLSVISCENPALLWLEFLYTMFVACFFFSAFVSYSVRLTNKYLKYIQAGLEKFKHCWIWRGENVPEWLKSAVSKWTRRPWRVKDQRASRALSVRASAIVSLDHASVWP